jgi:hypothetical protein
MLLKGRNMHVLRDFTVLFFYWNHLNTKLSLDLNKNKAAYRGVFIISIWLPNPSVWIWPGPDAWVWNGGQAQACGSGLVARLGVWVYYGWQTKAQVGHSYRIQALGCGMIAGPRRLGSSVVTRPRSLGLEWLRGRGS